MIESRVEAMRALLAAHEDEGIGLEAKRQHTYTFKEPDGREHMTRQRADRFRQRLAADERTA